MLAWRHKIGPGFLIIIAALCFGAGFILQLLVTIGLPTIKSIYFYSYTLDDLDQQVEFGLFTICTSQFLSSFSMNNYGQTCQKPALGYEGSQYGVIADYLFIHNLSKALVLQPIATAFAALAFVACGLHLCSNFIIWPFLSLLAGTTSLLTFLIEIILFTVARVRFNSTEARTMLYSGTGSSSYGPAIWIQLAGSAIVLFGLLMSWTAYIRRKMRGTHKGKLGTSSTYQGSVVGTKGKDTTASKRHKYKNSDYIKSGAGGAAGAAGLFTASRWMGSRKDNNGGDHESEIALKDMGAPIAGQRTFAAHRKRVPEVDEKGDVYGSSSARKHSSAPVQRKAVIYGGDRRKSSNPTTGAAAGAAAAGATTPNKSGNDYKDYSAARRARRAARGSGAESSGGSDRASSPEMDRRQRHRSSGGYGGSRRASSRGPAGGGSSGGESGGGRDADLGYLLGARPRSSPNASRRAASAGYSSDRGGSRSAQGNYSEDGEDSMVISPRRGKRAARYSARMAEDGF